jgi:putative hydrolase of the HAD superfamily
MNIVFDLGGVVFNWQPQKLISSVFADAETQNLIMTDIVEHPDWQDFDRGTLEREQAIVRGARRSGLAEDDIRALFDAVPGSLTPIQGTIDLINVLALTEHRLFVLSNMSIEVMEHLEAAHDFWDKFEGKTISSRIKLIKPEIEIYEHLLTTHGLVASETVFIDDLEKNVAAASTLGIHTIRFVSPEQCRQDLTRLNCL